MSSDRPVNKGELIKALNQKGWSVLGSKEVVNTADLRELHSYVTALVSKGKKLCVPIIERD